MSNHETEKLKQAIKETGGSAFPESYSPDYPHETRGNLTVRDYFAAHAPIDMDDARTAYADTHGYRVTPTYGEILSILCLLKLEYADAMIAERAK